MRLAEIAAVVGGRVEPEHAGVEVVAPAAIDSRVVEPGGLFVALAGEHTDGHAFVGAAADRGAAAVLAARPVGAPYVLVDDPAAALSLLAAEVRRRLRGCAVIGITGSQGKTSVKDLLAQVLAAQGATVATAGNFNNEIGVPLTLLRADASTRYLVVEMGARHVGNIAELCALARPDVGVVLNVGSAHVGEFGSREAIAQAKGELVEALSADGTAVLNASDEAVVAMRSRTAARVSTFGADEEADVAVRDVVLRRDGTVEADLRLAGRWSRLRLGLLGAHQATNAAAAAAAALAVGITPDVIVRELGAASPRSAWRMERAVTPDGVVVVNDAYNANPESTASALRTLAAMTPTDAASYAVLGEMLELGGAAARAHADVGSLAAELGLTHVVAVGAGAHGVHDAARAAGAASVAVADVTEAVGWLRTRIRPGDVVLVKASRASGLDRVAAALLEPRDFDEGDDAR
ncbi:UDP-N-acetylmuramoyl-tripeptide--D-alanyl-D-alanine ligase [Mumia flava]|uniref:UDP-N-acetylmuramoyl-tripeptide--D-alanyl-D-alanine ligase n=1 Tax=Mumia flava TaxID=1348852 RepID=A0A2M9BDL2_9ACTN|nr:UDP-N-acetylmuramoyl-tripeptide--D-alanyl-D-alanine ligase [Mumia flava]